MSEVIQHKQDRTGASANHVTLSEAAKQHILHYLSKDKNYRGVWLSLKRSGCSGLSYVIDYINDYNEKDLVQPLNDDYNLYIDKQKYPYLKGLHIDYVREGLNYKYVYHNPNQKGQCGCGESFTVDS